MAFHDVRLPDYIESGAQGGPRFKTSILTLSSGFEKRNINWERSRGEWDISYGIQSQEDAEDVLAFFYSRQGRAHSFRFKDWTDFKAGSSSSPEIIGIGDGAKDKFQAVRKYSSGSQTYSRPLTRLVTGSVDVYLDGTKQTSGFTVDTSTGVVDFTTAPANGVQVGLVTEFDVPVRFDTDKLDLRAFFAGAVTLPSIDLIEVRETLVSI